jgi:hypothetical protein
MHRKSHQLRMTVQLQQLYLNIKCFMRQSLGLPQLSCLYHTGLSIYVTIFKIHPGQKSHSEDRKAAELEEIWKF